jgi:hypothetical protein
VRTVCGKRKSFREILEVRAVGKRLIEDVSAETLDDITNDAAEQAEMYGRLRRMIAKARL